MGIGRQVAVVVVAVVVVASSAHAGDEPRVKRVRETGHVITDGKGHYLAFINDPTSLSTGDDDAQLHAWYGDGKTFHAIDVVVGGEDGNPDWQISDIRVGYEKEHSMLYAKKDGFTLRCDERRTALSRVPTDEARAMLKKAAFKPRRLASYAFAVAREGTTYYVLDVPRDITQKTVTAARLFIGKRGALKPLKVTRIESDIAQVVRAAHEPHHGVGARSVVDTQTRREARARGSRPARQRSADLQRPRRVSDAARRAVRRLVRFALACATPLCLVRLGLPCDDLYVGAQCPGKFRGCVSVDAA